MPPLVELFLDQIARMHNLKSLAIGSDAVAVLQAQDWPGNARQLRNSIERLLILIKDAPPENGVITAADAALRYRRGAADRRRHR